MKKSMKCLLTICALSGVLFLTQTAAAKAYGVETVFPDEVNTETEYATESGTPVIDENGMQYAEVRGFRTEHNPFTWVIAFGVMGSLAVLATAGMKRRSEKDMVAIEREKLELEKYKLANNANQEKESTAASVSEKKTIKLPQAPSVTTYESDSPSAAVALMEKAAANVSMQAQSNNVNDTNGDGVVDSFDIPSFMR